MEIDSTKWKNVIRIGARDFGLQLTATQVDQFAIHAKELIQWTRKINLTAIKNPLEIAVKHFLDSIVTANIIPKGAALLDIGSGGGFPGLPLKIVMPSLSVTLIDASQKKVSFLKHVIRRLNLENIEARHIRAEELKKERAYTEAFDVIISRALSDVDTFVDLSLPLLSKDGMMLALKSTPPQSEIQAIKQRLRQFQGKSEKRYRKLAVTIEDYTLPHIGSKRSVFSIKMDESEE